MSRLIRYLNSDSTIELPLTVPNLGIFSGTPASRQHFLGIWLLNVSTAVQNTHQKLRLGLLAEVTECNSLCSICLA